MGRSPPHPEGLSLLATEGVPPGPHLPQLLQLALSLRPLQLQVRHLAPHRLHLLGQGAALLPGLGQRLPSSLQPFLGDRG